VKRKREIGVGEEKREGGELFSQLREIKRNGNEIFLG
jgi:hypothetical protein